MYTAENVMNIAEIAKIKISVGEAQDISSVLTLRNEYLCSQLDKCPASACDPENITRQKNVFRQDILEESLSNEKALSGVNGRDGFFYLPKRQAPGA